MRRNRRVLQSAIEAVFQATVAERTVTLYSQSFDFDDVRVLGYRRLKNMAALILLLSQYIASGEPERILSEGQMRFNCGNVSRPPGQPTSQTYSYASG